MILLISPGRLLKLMGFIVSPSSPVLEEGEGGGAFVCFLHSQSKLQILKFEAII
jgi:hypothetical protein